MDQYLVKDASYNRLFDEYKKYNSLVVAYDFDNTIFDFHNEGCSYNQVISLLKDLSSINCYMICWTAREDIDFVKSFLNDKNIPYDSINENPYFFKSNAKKIYYNVLLDDRAGLIQTYNELSEIVFRVKGGQLYRKVLYAPESLQPIKNLNAKSIFLAGSIEMGKAVEWQKELTDLLYINNIIDDNNINSPFILNPRRLDWDSSWKQEYGNPNFFQQVNWELNALEKCTYIVMYFDPNTASPITLVEFGKYVDSGKLLVYCPDKFYKKGNIDITGERYNVKSFNNFDDIIDFLTMNL